jgi:hypothetical protein
MAAWEQSSSQCNSRIAPRRPACGIARCFAAIIDARRDIAGTEHFLSRNDSWNTQCRKADIQACKRDTAANAETLDRMADTVASLSVTGDKRYNTLMGRSDEANDGLGKL